jgi:predicted DNA-binding protein YlxM (UPF0122 family)
MAKVPYEFIHIVWDEWVKLYKEGVTVIQIAKQYNKKTTTIYSVLRKHLAPLDYYERKVRNYENMERGRKAIRAAVIQHVKELRPLEEVQAEFGLSKYGVTYYVRKYLTPEQRKAYFRHMRRKQYNTVQKMIPILAEINKMGNIPLAAKSLGMKLNSVFVFLKRNDEVVRILTGKGYEDLLIQPKLGVHKIANKKYSQ